MAGRVKTIVFDKTGTLTEDSLKFGSVTLANQNSFDKEVRKISSLSINQDKGGFRGYQTDENKSK